MSTMKLPHWCYQLWRPCVACFGMTVKHVIRFLPLIQFRGAGDLLIGGLDPMKHQVFVLFGLIMCLCSLEIHTQSASYAFLWTVAGNTFQPKL